MGLALLIAAGVAGASLWSIGLVGHVAEPTPAPTVSIGPQEQVLLCNESAQSVDSTTCNGRPTPIAVDSAYIGPGHIWVVAANLPNDDIIVYRPPYPGVFLETNSNASKVVSGIPVNCALEQLTYPGSGTRIAAECSLFGPARDGYGLVVIDWQTLSVVSELGLGNSSCSPPILLPGGGGLLCPTGDSGGGWGPTRLLTLNLTTGAVEHNVTLPAGMDSFPRGLWRDPETGLVVGVTYNRSQVFTIDPSTGRTTLGPQLGVNLTIAGYDPTRELLYASGAMRGDIGPANLTVVNVTSLRTVLVRQLPDSIGWGAQLLIDDSHGDVWIPTHTGTDVLSTASWDVVARTPFGFGTATTDGATDTLVVTGPAQSVDLWVYPVLFGTTSVAPYESIPLIGSGLPWFVAGAFALGGAEVLVVQYHRRSVDRRKARWQELDAEFEGRRRPRG